MLTFVIPTFERTETLEPLLKRLTREIEKHGDGMVAIFVHDDASQDDKKTQDVLRNYRAAYPGMFDYIRSKENKGRNYHLGNFYSLQAAINGSQTEWTWMLGDDDMLNVDMLPVILKILENTDSNYFHVAEDTRCKGTNGMYSAPFEHLCMQMGLHEMAGFISSTLMRTDLLKAIYSDEMGEKYKSAGTLGYCCAYYDVLYGKKCTFLDLPAITLQDKEQTAKSIERWGKANVVLGFSYLAKGIELLEADGKLTFPLPRVFFRYLNADIITKVTFAYIEYAAHGVVVDESDWANLYRMASWMPEEDREQRTKYLDALRKSLQATAKAVLAAKKKLDMSNGVFEDWNEIIYPYNYLP